MPGAGRVAVTGACGRIGRALVEHLTERGYDLLLLDQPGRGLDTMRDRGDVVELDLAEQAPDGLYDGVEVVIHLAGEASETAPWERLLPSNIGASYHVAHGAMKARCRRVIFASSVHAVLASAHRPVAPDGYVAPADLYGVSKCFVEALAFWCAHHGPISAAAVRIGGVLDLEEIAAGHAHAMADLFIAAPDLLALLERAIIAEYRFAILHAAAPGPQALLDTRATEDLLRWSAQHRVPPAADG